MTYYDILEISEKASDEVVKMAYKALAKKYHPDIFTGDPLEAEEKMKQINAAFEVLSDPQKRKQYDNFLHNSTNTTYTEENPQSNKPPKKGSRAKREFKYPSGTKSATIIGVLLFLLFLLPIGTYAEYPALYDYVLLLGAVYFCLNCSITMTIPMLLGVILKNLTPKKINVICLVNSAAVFTVSLVLNACGLITSMFTGWIQVVLYYFINKHILLQINKRPINKKKSLISIIVVCAILLSIAIGGDAISSNLLRSSGDKASSNGKDTSYKNSSSEKITLVVALENDFVPFSYKEGNTFKGIHIDIAKEMAKRMDCDVEFVSVDFDKLIDGVNNGTYDLAFGIDKTPDREEMVKFTASYYDGMHAIFNSDSFNGHSKITTTLNNMIKDGTVRNIILKYKTYLPDYGDLGYYIDFADVTYDLTGYDQWAIVRTIALGDKSTAESIYAEMERAIFDEAKVKEIMDSYGANQGGGTGYLIEPGVFIEEVDEWCFANDRIAGDIAIIENSYGYSICYITAIYNQH